jgi:broad specificity phosphatase PhoE
MDPTKTQQHQYVVVMRHGDRIDNFEPLWVTKSERPWDPPLIEAGLSRAFTTGQKLKTRLGFPIHRVFVSPFLRCVQTARETVTALCAVGDVSTTTTGGLPDGSSIDPSKLKVSIEYGLCEMLTREAIRPTIAPKDGDFGFNVSELEALLPAGTVDHSVKRVYQELPRWEETVLGARSRYVKIIKALANMYPSENLLLVTHGEGVGVAVSTSLEDATVYDVEYCGYVELRRKISYENESFTAGNFEVSRNPTQTGISYSPSTNSTDVFTN